MKFSRNVDSPRKWLVFRLAALNRASRLLRHLTPIAAYLHADNSESPLPVLPDDRDGKPLDEFSFFQVEQKLFKVHMSLFRLELWSPALSGNSTQTLGTADPVVISETADNFRYFIWDLHAFPHELSHLKAGDSDVIPVVERLLNITEMASKHNFSALEIRALESLRQFVLSPYFHSASSAQYCRALSLATRSNFGHDLLRDLSRRLINRILRPGSSLAPALVCLVEQNSLLQRIRGVVYYRQLIDMEWHPEGRPATQPEFPPFMDVEQRMRFLAAHVSLSAFSARLYATAPSLPADGCRSHPLCLSAWEDIWARAAAAAQTTLLGSADVLGRLRVMTPLLKRMVSEAPLMPVDCGLAALEAVVTLGDNIVDGLMEHFI
ncbi:hypothetical protein C8R44DRAFT_870895 [Mycena epipterygia]|nr:hypothetical protein C8R44DRAFT_870895 [Mycena epipterygia]